MTLPPAEAVRPPVSLRMGGAVALVVLAGAAASVLLIHNARSGSATAAYTPPPVEVSAFTVAPETLPRSLAATGTLQAVKAVVLAPEVAGRITGIFFTAGQHVAQGAVLVRLFDAPELADRAAETSRAEFAEVQYQRSRELAPSGAEPRELLQQRQAQLDQALAAIRQVDARLSQRVIKAPFAGVLGIRRIDPGQYVNAGDPVATLTALDRLYVNFAVPQQQLSRLHVGGAVAVRSDALPGRTFFAHINAVEPVVGGDTRNVSVQAEMANPGEFLRPGLYVSVDVTQPSRPDALLTPTTAIQTSASGDSVYVVRQGRAALIPVVIGDQVGDRTVVESGLTPGDVVVTTGQLRLQPGAMVKVAPEPAAAKTR